MKGHQLAQDLRSVINWSNSATIPSPTASWVRPLLTPALQGRNRVPPSQLLCESSQHLLAHTRESHSTPRPEEAPAYFSRTQVQFKGCEVPGNSTLAPRGWFCVLTAVDLTPHPASGPSKRAAGGDRPSSSALCVSSTWAGICPGDARSPLLLFTLFSCRAERPQRGGVLSVGRCRMWLPDSLTCLVDQGLGSHLQIQQPGAPVQGCSAEPCRVSTATHTLNFPTAPCLLPCSA